MNQIPLLAFGGAAFLGWSLARPSPKYILLRDKTIPRMSQHNTDTLGFPGSLKELKETLLRHYDSDEDRDSAIRSYARSQNKTYDEEKVYEASEIVLGLLRRKEREMTFDPDDNPGDLKMEWPYYHDWEPLMARHAGTRPPFFGERAYFF